MSIIQKIKRALRGDVAAKTVAREALRRSHATIRRRRERASLQHQEKQAARLQPRFAGRPARELVAHFRNRSEPQFLPGFSLPSIGDLQAALFPEQTIKLLRAAECIVNDHNWPLLGLIENNFRNPINWHRDPLTGNVWPLDYHADINLIRGDGSDVRLLWELNRMPHLITLARAYAVSKDERLSAEFFRQVRSWRDQNPYGRGVNWACAMEVSLRAMNLLGAFAVFRHSRLLNEQTLSALLALFDQHGMFIRQNLEFSYLATSNHYLSDIAGLVWLGVMLPELNAAAEWREFGLCEMLREMDKQVLADGAHFEASTGYHCFVLELFLYTFLLCRANGIDIEERYWRKLHDMLDYACAYLRPDGRAPLIGDSDGGHVFPLGNHAGDDHAYVLALGAVVFDDPRLKPAGLAMPEEVLWILGKQRVNRFQELKDCPVGSEGFPNAGTYILRDRDLYLLFNASDAGIYGRGSHGHNDALSIEVSICGRPFIVDPGSYVYTADLQERHLFRSTAYHSTVEIDGLEQNTTAERLPFVIGNEARPRVTHWESNAERDQVIAEHIGYARLPQPVTHRRTVTFYKQERWWLIEDEFSGNGEHDLAARFHFDEGLELSLLDERLVRAYDKLSSARLFVYSLDLSQNPKFESQFTSRDYHVKRESLAACWRLQAKTPCAFRWVLVPACENLDDSECLGLLARVREQS